MNEYRRAEKWVEVSVFEPVRIQRELQEMSQNGLATATGIPQSTISVIENSHVRLGVDHAKVLGPSFAVSPCRPFYSKRATRIGSTTRIITEVRSYAHAQSPTSWRDAQRALH